MSSYAIAPAFGRYKSFIFDLDGTIYLGDRLIPGAAAVVDALRASGRRVVFLSNKPLDRCAAYAAKLTRLGIPTAAEEVINSAYVLASHLARESPGARVYCAGEPPLLAELAEQGLRVLTEEEALQGPVDVVIAAFDRTLHYGKLNAAFQALKAGARFLATNSDRTCPVDGGELPDAAGVIAYLEATTGRRVELIAGKPSVRMLEIAALRLQVPVGECLMSGDRLETDMRMGMAAGMATAAVLSGVSNRQEAEAFRQANGGKAPTHILTSVAEIIGQ